MLFALSDKSLLYDAHLFWSIPCSLFLVSVRWWENYVDRESRLGPVRKWFNRLAGDIRRTRTKTQLLASAWKIGLNMVLMMLCVALQLSGTDLSWNERLTAVFHIELR